MIDPFAFIHNVWQWTAFWAAWTALAMAAMWVMRGWYDRVKDAQVMEADMRQADDAARGYLAVMMRADELLGSG
jgi:hypothetical protein